MSRSDRGQRDFRTHAARTKGSVMVRRMTTRCAKPKGRKAREASIGAIKSTRIKIDKHYRITQRLQGITSVIQATCVGSPSPDAAGSTGTVSSAASTAWMKSSAA